MSPAEMIAKLDALHATGKFFGFTIWPTNAGYQANLQTVKAGGWRVRRATTPSEAIALVLEMDFMDDDGLPPRMLAPPDVDEPPGLELEDAFEGAGPDDAGIFD